MYVYIMHIYFLYIFFYINERKSGCLDEEMGLLNILNINLSQTNQGLDLSQTNQGLENKKPFTW